MKSVCGLDVHKDSVYLCIFSEFGELIEKVFGVLTYSTKKGGTPQIRAVPPMHKGWLSRLINYHFCRISQNLDEICSLLH